MNATAIEQETLRESEVYRIVLSAAEYLKSEVVPQANEGELYDRFRTSQLLTEVGNMLFARMRIEGMLYDMGTRGCSL